MKNKIIIINFLIILLFQVLIPIKVNAGIEIEKKEVEIIPAKIERYYVENIVSETTGLDTYTGILLEPTVKFFSVVVDFLMEALTAFMTQNDFDLVMKVTKTDLEGNVGATYTFTDDDMNAYKNAIGNMSIKYPNFTYSPEEIFSGNIDLLDVNFINKSNNDEGWNQIRNVISVWYKFLRAIVIVGLLSVLIYTGIKIIINSNAKNKAKYKEFIINWFVGVVLAFTLHYIMAFILNCIEEIMKLLQGLTGVIEVQAGNVATFKTNLIGLARFQLQQMHFSAKITYLIVYTALVTYTFKFTFIYLKRMIKMAFLTVISPIVALTYPLEKMDGKARGFQMWLREFLFNALLQPVHYILYYILVSSSLSLAAKNPIYAIVALMFVSQGEKLLKKIFGFGKATGGTVEGLSGAFTTTAVISTLKSFVKNPLHPFGGGKNKKDVKANKLDSYNIENDNIAFDFIEDADFSNLLNEGYGNNYTQRNQDTQQNVETIENQRYEEEQNGLNRREISGIGEFLSYYREKNKNLTINQLGGVEFEDGDLRSLEELLEEIGKYQREIDYGYNSQEQIEVYKNEINKLEDLLKYRVIANEMNLLDGTELQDLQYLDGNNDDTSYLMSQIIELTKLANNTTNSIEKRKYTKQANKLLKKVKRRIAENQYIQKQGGIKDLMQQEGYYVENNSLVNNANQVHNNIGTGEVNRINNNEETEKNVPKVAKGILNVGKKIIKPVWNVEKDAGENAKRLTGKIARGIAGTAIGITGATVQAGISITDGKYNPMEGVATFSAGFVGAQRIAQTTGRIVSKEDDMTLERYKKQWFNRDDIIEKFNTEFPGEGKLMRRRARDNYVTRGITDVNAQKKAIKYANLLKKEKGMEEEEADKLAVATLQYKRNLTLNSNYAVMFDEKKRNSYLDVQAKSYSGSASKESVKQLHRNFIENVRDFDRANR